MVRPAVRVRAMSISTKVLRLAVCTVLAGGAIAACGGDDDGGSASAFCDKVQELDEFEFDFEAEDTTAQEEEFEELLNEAQDLAPDEIKDDMEVVMSEDADPESDEYKEAEERLDKYVKDECGIDTTDE